MRKIADVLREKRARGQVSFSFEVFPPKTAKGLRNLITVVEDLAQLNPDYVSVTYGAGGSTSKATLEIIKEIHEKFGLTCMHHLTLVNQTRDTLAETIRAIIDAGVTNILALRGDPPPEFGGSFHKIEGGLEYCYQLIDLIRDIAGDTVSIGVAGFPQGHVQCPSKDLDTRYLKMKLDHGADFVVTQLFFDNNIYTEYLQRTAAAGIDVPIIPGLLPITDYDKLVSFCQNCGAFICEEVHNVFRPLSGQVDATMAAGHDFALNQSRDLIRRTSPAVHFYCLNKVQPVRNIWTTLKQEFPAH